jgi:hypothetical protein
MFSSAPDKNFNGLKDRGGYGSSKVINVTAKPGNNRVCNQANK